MLSSLILARPQVSYLEARAPSSAFHVLISICSEPPISSVLHDPGLFDFKRLNAGGLDRNFYYGCPFVSSALIVSIDRYILTHLNTAEF